MAGEMGSEMGADMSRDVSRYDVGHTEDAMREADGNYFLLGAMLGAAVGTAVALLFTPKPGEELRGTIREKGIELRRRAADEVPGRSDVAGTARSAMRSARAEVESVADNVSSAADDVESAWDDVADSNRTV